MRFHERAPFVPIVDRPPLVWPNGARLAVWVVPNIEHFEDDSLAGATVATPAVEPPDIPNYSWRDYGLRVGIWRTMRTLDRLGIRATVALNARACQMYPAVVEACVQRGWEIMGHGWSNSRSLSGLDEAEERARIAEALQTIESATGRRATGWLGSALAETSRTLDILAEHGIQYVGDWVNDEQPYPLRTAQGKTMVAMPYSIELNDIGTFLRRGYTGPDYERMLLDHFEVLYAEGSKVLCVPLHPYLTGVPFRAKYLDRALSAIREHSDVWFATGSEILAAYLDSIAGRVEHAEVV